MTTSLTFMLIAIAVILVVAILVFLVRRERNENQLTSLAGLAFAFILAGIFFGENRLLGYGLMGVGVILSLIDMFRRGKRG